MKKNKLYFVACLFSFMSSVSFVYADTINPPDAGAVLKDIERNQEKKQLDLPKETESTAKPKKEQTGNKVKIKSFDFKGNDHVTTEELEKILHNYVGQELYIQDIQELPTILNNYYRTKGWLSDITLPDQDITDGVIRFNVTEAKFGGSSLIIGDQETNYYVNPSIIKGIINGHLNQDNALSLTQLDRALLIANDLSGVSVKGVMQAGKKSGETEVAISVKNKPFYRCGEYR